MSEFRETPGAQSLRRVLRMLQLLCEHHSEGLRATEVMRLTGLERSTAHRLLACLVEERFADRDPLSRRYRLGSSSMRLGLTALKDAQLISSYQEVVRRIAQMSEDTVFLVARQGNHTICLLREDGAFPVKIFSTRVGDIRPLGPGLGGMALMATTSNAQIDAVCRLNVQALNAVGLTRPRIEQIIESARALGYVEMMNTVTQGVGGVGAVIPDAGQPFAAVAIAAIEPRMSPARRAELGRMIVEELAKIGA